MLHYNEQLLVYLKVIHWTSLCPGILSPALSMPITNMIMVPLLLNCVHVQCDERIKEHQSTIICPSENENVQLAE